MTMPVPMPLTRFTDGAAPVNGSAGVGTVRSLWMLTTAARTLRAASTAGVTRGLELVRAGVPAIIGAMGPRPRIKVAAARRRVAKWRELIGVPKVLLGYCPGMIFGVR